MKLRFGRLASVAVALSTDASPASARAASRRRAARASPSRRARAFAARRLRRGALERRARPARTRCLGESGRRAGRGSPPPSASGRRARSSVAAPCGAVSSIPPTRVATAGMPAAIASQQRDAARLHVSTAARAPRARAAPARSGTWPGERRPAARARARAAPPPASRCRRSRSASPAAGQHERHRGEEDVEALDGLVRGRASRPASPRVTGVVGHSTPLGTTSDRRVVADARSASSRAAACEGATSTSVRRSARARARRTPSRARQRRGAPQVRIGQPVQRVDAQRARPGASRTHSPQRRSCVWTTSAPRTYRCTRTAPTGVERPAQREHRARAGTASKRRRASHATARTSTPSAHEVARQQHGVLDRAPVRDRRDERDLHSRAVARARAPRRSRRAATAAP